MLLSTNNNMFNYIIEFIRPVSPLWSFVSSEGNFEYSLAFGMAHFGNLHTKVQISLLPTGLMLISTNNNMFNYIIGLLDMSVHCGLL